MEQLFFGFFDGHRHQTEESFFSPSSSCFEAQRRFCFRLKSQDGTGVLRLPLESVERKKRGKKPAGRKALFEKKKHRFFRPSMGHRLSGDSLPSSLPHLNAAALSLSPLLFAPPPPFLSKSPPRRSLHRPLLRPGACSHRGAGHDGCVPGKRSRGENERRKKKTREREREGSGRRRKSIARRRRRRRRPLFSKPLSSKTHTHLFSSSSTTSSTRPSTPSSTPTPSRSAATPGTSSATRGATRPTRSPSTSTPSTPGPRPPRPRAPRRRAPSAATTGPSPFLRTTGPRAAPGSSSRSSTPRATRPAPSARTPPTPSCPTPSTGASPTLRRWPTCARSMCTRTARSSCGASCRRTRAWCPRSRRRI